MLCGQKMCYTSGYLFLCFLFSVAIRRARRNAQILFFTKKSPSIVSHFFIRIHWRYDLINLPEYL